MPTSEIEKLERRYAENPHGLTFAPLAEVHRKNGDVPRALELLTAGLELHPNYIPASIVLGRCHQDLDDLPSAEAAFAHVLRLDDENVIALKSLADISERLERFVEAETWLRRLVSVDRSNDEAREQLRRVETAKQSEQGTPAAEAAPAPSLEMVDLAPEPPEQSAEPAVSPAELLPVDIAAMESQRLDADQPPTREIDSREEPPAQPAPPPAAAAAAEEAPNEEPQDLGEPEREVVVTAAPDMIPAAASSPPPAEEPSGQEETVRPLPGLISAEFQPPLEAIGGLGVETSEEVVLEVSGESEFQIPDASEDMKSLSVQLNPPPATPPVTSQPAAAQVVQPDSKQKTEPTSYAAAETKGQSVAAFFRALVSARLPSAGNGAPEQRRSAAPTSSLRGEEISPVAPAVPSGEQKSDAAVSFDDFFSSEADDSNPLRQGNPDSGKDDLDQFQSWLQNLKR